MMVAVDAHPQLDLRAAIQVTDHSENLETKLIFVIGGAEPCTHASVGMEVQHRIIGDQIPRRSGAGFLLRDVHLVLATEEDCHVLLLPGINEHLVQPPVKEFLRDQAVTEENYEKAADIRDKIRKVQTETSRQ